MSLKLIGSIDACYTTSSCFIVPVLGDLSGRFQISIALSVVNSPRPSERSAGDVCQGICEVYSWKMLIRWR